MAITSPLIVGLAREQAVRDEAERVEIGGGRPGAPAAACSGDM